MPVIFINHLSRHAARSHPDALFVFGDNMHRTGFGGQAKEMRGEPNAVGIPTKHAPRRDDGAYFTDADFETVKPEIHRAFLQLVDHVKTGKTVYWPDADIGTGLADLPSRAPRLWRYLQRCKIRLCEIAAE